LGGTLIGKVPLVGTADGCSGPTGVNNDDADAEDPMIVIVDDFDRQTAAIDREMVFFNSN
jgi:hypothetical protein